MAFNSNTYHAGKWRRKAAAELAEARAMKARLAAGTAFVTDAPERVAMFARLARCSARLARNYEFMRALQKGERMILGTRDYELSASVTRRANVEGKVARRLVVDLLAAGFTISVHNGEDFELKRSTSVKKITAAMWSTDEDYLMIYKAGAKERFGWVKFVYGNDGWDVINDYTTNLEPWMAGTNKVIEANS